VFLTPMLHAWFSDPCGVPDFARNTSVLTRARHPVADPCKRARRADLGLARRAPSQSGRRYALSHTLSLTESLVRAFQL